MAELVASLTELLRPLYTLLIATFPLVGGYLLIKLFFEHANRSTPDSVRHLIESQLEKSRYAELRQEYDPLLNREKILAQKKRELELEEAMLDNEQTAEKAALNTKIQDTEEALAEVRQAIEKKHETFHERAKEYARHIVKDLTVEGIISAKNDARPIVIQYATVTIIIASVLSLATQQLLTAEQIAPILAAIAGYVLGKTSNNPA